MSKIEVLSAEVWWGDGYENSPSLTFELDRAPAWDVYERRPCAREMLSSDQVAIVGGSTSSRPTPGWHAYWSHDDGFVWFFTWGGKPDDGFGGHRRTIKLLDGSEELVVGGWHTGPSVALKAGFPPIVECAYRAVGGYRTAMACFVTLERFEAEVARLLPDIEVIGSTVKWRGRPSKAEFMAAERERRNIFRDELKAKYHDGSWHGGDWYKSSTKEERAELSCRPYSALGPSGLPETPGLRVKSVAL